MARRIPVTKLTCAPRVLLAEDDPDLRFLLSQGLEQAGFEVRAASDGHGIFELLRQSSPAGPPDVFVIDVCMPRMSGLDALRALRLGTLSQPVVLVTGLGEPAIRAEAMACGAAAVIEKPVDVEDLTEVVRLLAYRHRAELRGGSVGAAMRRAL